jgi:hypothetical protein
VKLEDLGAGVLQASWALGKKHPAVTGEQSSAFLTKVSIGILLSSVEGAWDISDEFNQLFPDCKLDGMEEFLARIWGGRT